MAHSPTNGTSKLIVIGDSRTDFGYFAYPAERRGACFELRLAGERHRRFSFSPKSTLILVDGRVESAALEEWALSSIQDDSARIAFFNLHSTVPRKLNISLATRTFRRLPTQRAILQLLESIENEEHSWMSTRASLRSPVRIHSTLIHNGVRFQAVTENVCTTGAAFKMIPNSNEGRFNPGDKFDLMLSTKSTNLQLKSEVAWCRSTPNGLEIGTKFRAMTTEMSLQLTQQIHDDEHVTLIDA